MVNEAPPLIVARTGKSTCPPVALWALKRNQATFVPRVRIVPCHSDCR